MMNNWMWINEVGVNGFFDIAFMALLIYIGLVWIKRTRAGFVLTGIVIAFCLYLLARQFNLVMATSVFEKFFAVILITLIVIFQEDLKYFFEQVAVWSLNRRFKRKSVATLLSNPSVDILIRTAMDLAREKIGALIVLRGKDMIIRHLEGGEELNGEISEPLLKSIFDPHSTGHDGAVIVEGNKITQFSCHLPLSKNLQKIKNHGTRHAAALGLCELTDALCLVVSEEKGTIALVRHGDIEKIKDPQELKSRLERFYQEVSPRPLTRPWQDFLKKNTREKVYAGVLSMMLWFVFVYGAKEVYQSYNIPVAYTKIPESWSVDIMDPKTVEVTLRGQRRDLYIITERRFKLLLELDPDEDQQIVRINPEDFLLPKGAHLEDFEPKEVRVLMKKK